MVEPGEVKQSNYLNKDWSAGESTSSGCDKMTIKEPRTQFLFGYTLLARYQNSYWNPNYGKIQDGSAAPLSYTLIHPTAIQHDRVREE